MSKFFLVLILNARMVVIPEPYPTLDACNLGGRTAIERMQSPTGGLTSFTCVEVIE